MIKKINRSRYFVKIGYHTPEGLEESVRAYNQEVASQAIQYGRLHGKTDPEQLDCATRYLRAGLESLCEKFEILTKKEKI